MDATDLARAEEAMIALAEECGFECVGACDASALQVRPEVRDMCNADVCQNLGKNWMCPPYCGEIEEYAEKISHFSRCVVVQTVAQLEDSFDFETMIEANETQHERFYAYVPAARKLLAERVPSAELFALSAGTCTICPTCGCPDEPCRHPEEAYTSMEAGGLVVAEVCTAAGIPYNHGDCTLAYSSCILI